MTIAMGDLKGDGRGEINGYLALQADKMFRVRGRCDRRRIGKTNGRTTPVKGDFAWFRREAFQLQVKISRRARRCRPPFSPTRCPWTGPSMSTAGWSSTYCIRAWSDCASQGPGGFRRAILFQMARKSQSADRDGDTWTIVLQKDITGYYALKFHAVIPFDESKADFQVDVPNVEPLDVKQQTGTWAVEANTSTEISFESTGMNELDPLRTPPPCRNYQPRHHVIGVYGYLGLAAFVEAQGREA